MKSDSLREYTRIRKALIRERARLKKKLAEIDEALGSDVWGSEGRNQFNSSTKTTRAGNPMSLREAIRTVTAKRPLTKREILDEIDKLGYKFSSDKPVNSLNSILYAKKQFKNQNGRFSPA